ncbi:DUF6011 domain-containing protein [Gracilibacillus sp. D59]|uniref:DUF6011 domain-containing protein n=1 Tax=Gracilibacillus sp. D59 TaxID=3457434 RepID=UPI003FCCDEAB
MAELALCGRCNRKLKDRKSLGRGFGPVCWQKVKEDKVVGKSEQGSTTGRSEGA